MTPFCSCLSAFGGRNSTSRTFPRNAAGALSPPPCAPLPSPPRRLYTCGCQAQNGVRRPHVGATTHRSSGLLNPGAHTRSQAAHAARLFRAWARAEIGHKVTSRYNFRHKSLETLCGMQPHSARAVRAAPSRLQTSPHAPQCQADRGPQGPSHVASGAPAAGVTKYRRETHSIVGHRIGCVLSP